MTELKDWIRQARESLGMTQERFGALFDKSKGNVSAWEIGRHRPKMEDLVAISRRSGLPLPPELEEMNVEPATMGERKIPVISYVVAGQWKEISDPYPVGAGMDVVTTDAHVSDNAFALRITGDSMLPKFTEGDLVIIDPNIAPRPGDFVVAKNHDEAATFKKYRPRGHNRDGEPWFELLPLNQDYPTITSEETPISIIGVMVEHRQFRKR